MKSSLRISNVEIDYKMITNVWFPFLGRDPLSTQRQKGQEYSLVIPALASGGPTHE